MCTDIHKAKLILAPWVLKRYEESIDCYCFYNAKTKKMWSSDFSVGSVVSILDGSLSGDEVIKILATGNLNISFQELENTFISIFNTLKEGEFLIV